MKYKTKDEKFIIGMYQAALELGDIESPVNRYQVGDKLGLYVKGVDTICQMLLQANFVKKGGLDDLCLTAHGVNLVKELME